jgi:hypothetical protein
LAEERRLELEQLAKDKEHAVARLRGDVEVARGHARKFKQLAIDVTSG